MANLTVAEIGRATLTVLRPQFWTMFAVAAPFTLLVDMGVSLFGPPQPKSFAEFTPILVMIHVVVPGLIGAIAQLAVARMVAMPGDPPRAALAAAFAVLPAYIGAVLLSAVPTGLAFLALLVPGLYVMARLFLIVPVAVIERCGPVDILKRSWAMTAADAWTLLLFLLAAFLFVIAAGTLASGIGAALASVLTLVGGRAGRAFCRRTGDGDGGHGGFDRECGGGDGDLSEAEIAAGCRRVIFLIFLFQQVLNVEVAMFPSTMTVASTLISLGIDLESQPYAAFS